MKEIDKFMDNLERKVGEAKQAQLRFALCKSVNWDEKTMDATGLSDDVEYLDVQLGFGYIDIKPKENTTCLIGILEGNEALAFLINAEDVELVEIKSDKIEFNGGDNNGLVKSQSVADKISALERRCNDIVTALQGISVALAPTGTYPLAPFFAHLSPISPVAQHSDFENEKITH